MRRRIGIGGHDLVEYLTISYPGFLAVPHPVFKTCTASAPDQSCIFAYGIPGKGEGLMTYEYLWEYCSVRYKVELSRVKERSVMSK